MIEEQESPLNWRDEGELYELFEVYYKELIILQAGYMSSFIHIAKNAKKTPNLDNFLIERIKEAVYSHTANLKKFEKHLGKYSSSESEASKWEERANTFRTDEVFEKLSSGICFHILSQEFPDGNANLNLALGTDRGSTKTAHSAQSRIESLSTIREFPKEVEIIQEANVELECSNTISKVDVESESEKQIDSDDDFDQFYTNT